MHIKQGRKKYADTKNHKSKLIPNKHATIHNINVLIKYSLTDKV